MSFLRRVMVAGVVLYLLLLGYRIYSRKYYVWLPGYVRWALESDRAPEGPTHILLVYVDHFEPGDNYALVQRWVEQYPGVAAKHRDASGRPLQHSWFYPGEQPSDRNMQALRKLAEGGYGEIELHLHHGNDTQDSTRARMAQAIAYFQRFGFLKGVDGVTHFAFIHGNWGLDNSRGKTFCGANRELELLREQGCFADFTFPSLWLVSQPPFVNNIYEATDDERPKSYDHGVPLEVGVRPRGDLLIFQGPLVMVPAANPAKLFFVVEDGDMHAAVPASAWRVDAWVRARIHVKGRPEWRFLKIHTHGAQSPRDAEETLGPHFDAALRHLEEVYNDGSRYVLHYVTAREAVNVALAAVAGKGGDPRQYYDFAIPRYAAGRRP